MSSIKTQSPIQSNDNTLIVFNDVEDLTHIAKAISSPTRRKILKFLKNDKLDVSRIAKKMGQTEANISAQIKILEKAQLIGSEYKSGNHGIRKVCYLTVNKIEINLA